MIKKELELIINTGQATNALQGVDKAVNRIDKDLIKTDQEFGKVNKDAKDFDSTLKKVPKSTKKVVGGIKKIGLALKGIGIGLLISAIALLKELFSEQQKIVDVFAISFESLSIAFSDFFNFISKNVGAITGFFKKIFDDPLQAVKDLGIAIFNSLIKRMIRLQEAAGFLAEAFTHLFSGEFNKALKSVNAASGKIIDSVTGIDNTTGKLTKTVKEGVKSLTEYTKSTVKQATANVELKKTAELAAVANQGLIEKYDLLAESQRQIRDDERKSIEERKKANDELGLILEKQQVAMLQNAQLSLKAAKSELEKDKENIEFKKRVMEAENELAAVRATVAGFRSEQQTNEAALEREALELINSKLESENNLAIERKRFDAEQIEDELEKLERLKEIDLEEQEIETARLQNVINNTNVGTQAKIDAEIAYNEFLEESRQKNLTRDKEIADKRVANEQDMYDKLKAESLVFLNEELDKGKDKAEEEKELNNLKVQGVMNSLESIANLNALFAGKSKKARKRAFKIQKAVSISQTLISTAQSAVDSYKALSGIPVAGPALGFAAATAAVTAGLAQVKNIKQQKFDGGGSTITETSGGATTAPSQAPSFNVVGQSGFNQVAGALGQQAPVQAFVVSGDVTTAQQLQNNTITQATF